IAAEGMRLADDPIRQFELFGRERTTEELRPGDGADAERGPVDNPGAQPLILRGTCNQGCDEKAGIEMDHGMRRSARLDDARRSSRVVRAHARALARVSPRVRWRLSSAFSGSDSSGTASPAAARMTRRNASDFEVRHAWAIRSRARTVSTSSAYVLRTTVVAISPSGMPIPGIRQRASGTTRPRASTSERLPA